MREILTLVWENLPMQYYIIFSKERNSFIFEPTLKNKSAPSFTIIAKHGELHADQDIDKDLLKQAIQKVQEIISNDIFDSL